MYVTNNRASLHLWFKKNLAKHQKASKYHENDRLENFLLLFKSLLTSLIVKKQSYFGWDLFCLSKKCPVPNLKGFQNQIWTLVRRLGK